MPSRLFSREESFRAATLHDSALNAPRIGGKVSMRMQTTISVRHGSVEDATRELIETKLSKLQKFFDRPATLEVTLDLEPRNDPAMDVQLTADRKVFVVRVQAGDLRSSLDDALYKLEQQIKKYKEKMQDKRP